MQHACDDDMSMCIGSDVARRSFGFSTLNLIHKKNTQKNNTDSAILRAA